MDCPMCNYTMPEREAPTVPQCENCRQWNTWGIIESAVRNPNVMSYMEHWEARALKAEARLEALNDTTT